MSGRANVRRAVFCVLTLFIAQALNSCAHAPDPRFSFVALMVGDVDASAAWYARVFELREAHRVSGEGYDVRILANDELWVELTELSPPSPRSVENARGIYKAGLEIADFDDRVRAWQADGVRFYEDRVFVDEGLQLRYVIIEDVEGNSIQVFSRQR